MKETIMYKCDKCGQSFDNKRGALQCEFNHAKEGLANQCLEDGFDLDFINWICGFNWKLTEEMKKVNKDNCFIISHWQCCDKPAYRIKKISYQGNLYLFGIGSWSGGYGNWRSIRALKEPHPKEELYEHH